MKFIKNFLNYISILLIIVGFALIKILAGKVIIGWTILIAGVFLFFFYFYLNRKKFKSKLKRKALVYSSNLVIVVILVLAILIAVNILISKIQKRYDFTESNIYSLSPQTVKVIKNLKDDVNIKAFFTSETSSYADNTLKLYHFYSPKIKYEIIDPNKNPGLTKRYEITTDGTTVINYKDREQKITNLNEEELTNALIKITRKGTQTVCFLAGHGEANIENTEREGLSELNDSLNKLGYETKSLNLAENGNIPENCTTLAVVGPQKSFFESEVNMIEKYMKKGNNCLFMIDPGSGNKIENLTKQYGISLDDVVVVDAVSKVLSGDPLMPITNEYKDHDITRNFNFRALFPYARSVSALKPSPDNINVIEIAKTTNNAWGETDLQNESKTGKISFNPDKDKPGPVSLIAVSEIDIQVSEEESKMLKMVVTGDSDFVKNGFINAAGNKNLALNIINWLCQQEDLISITPKRARTSTITLSSTQGNIILYTTVIIIPLIILITGIIIWVRRRSL